MPTSGTDGHAHPRSGSRRSPSRGQHQRPGKAGSAVSAWIPPGSCVALRDSEEQVMTESETCIEFDDVLAGYGEFMILNNLSLKAKRGKITLLLGPNGAGKSTVLKTLFGMLKVRNGRIKLDGQDVTGASAKELLVKHGIAFVPQGRNLFGQLTAYENLELGGITLGMKTTRERIPEVLELFPR